MSVLKSFPQRRNNRNPDYNATPAVIKMNQYSRLFSALLSVVFTAAASMAAPGSSIQYNPTLKSISGNQPIVALPAPDPLSPINPYTLSITAPLVATSSFPMTVNVVFSIPPDPVGGVSIPLGVPQATALSYVTASPATLTFTAPGQQLNTIISVNVPQPAVSGSYGYLIKETWPAGLGIVDNGATINLTVLPPVISTLIKPAITSLLPANGSFFTYDPPTTGPITFPISYVATVATGGSVINGMAADIDGRPFNGTTPYVNGVPLPVLQVVGQGTLLATGSVQSPSITEGGPHTITVTAQNSDGTATATTTINVRTPPKFTSVDNATFTTGQPGSFTVTTTGFPSPTLALTGGTLPAGLTFDPLTGILSGTPTTAVGSPITLTFTATNAVRSVTQTFTLTILKVKVTPTIAWATPTAITYGTALSSVQLNATASAGGSPVSGSMTYTPAAGTILPAGTQTLNVTFTPTSTSDYNTATATVSIVVNKAPLSVTAANATKVYGTANPSFSAAISGFVNGDTATSALTGAAAVASSATTSSAAGTYSITPSVGTLAAANYTFNFINGTLTVSKAPLTVTANNASRPYGAANPTFAATITGFVNGDTTSAVTGAPAFTTTATTTSTPGAYPITPTVGGLVSTNYSFTTFVAGTLTVGKADQTITFGALGSKVLGSGTFALSATASSGLTVTYTSSNPAVATVSGSTVTLVSVGTAVITASQAGNTTYNAAPSVPQTLTVTAPVSCPTSILWLPPVSLNCTQYGGSCVPIKFTLQECCSTTTSSGGQQNGCNDRDDDGRWDWNHWGHNDDHTDSNVSCHHRTNDGRSTDDLNCRHNCDHQVDENHDGCVSLRDKTVVISIYEVGSSAPATQFKYGTGSPNPPDYIIDGDFKYQLNFPTARGYHRYHIDIYRFPVGVTTPVLVGSKEFTTWCW
jgi:hypothetical protein